MHTMKKRQPKRKFISNSQRYKGGLKLTEKYDVVGKIIDLERIEYRKEFYTKCDIELSCFDKQSSTNIDKIEE